LLLSHLDTFTLCEEDSERWCKGQLIDLNQAISSSKEISLFTPEHYLATYGAGQTFLGISILYERNEILKLKPKIVLV
jgi:tRNA pseudouridine55 synthase